MDRPKTVTGRRDRIDLPELALTNIRAKMDSGAYGSLIHCSASNYSVEMTGLYGPLSCRTPVIKVSRAKGVISIITDPFGEYKVRGKSHVFGRVISLNSNPLFHRGDAVMHIGIPE